MGRNHFTNNLLFLVQNDKPLDRYARMITSFSRVLKRDPCSYCGKSRGVTKDHIVPESRGGKRELDNITPACEKCNVQKGNMSLLEYLLWRNFPMERELKLEHKGVVLYVPPNTEPEELEEAVDSIMDQYYEARGAN